MFEDQPYPIVNRCRKGSLIIESTKDGDVGRVVGVGAGRLENHRQIPPAASKSIQLFWKCLLLQNPFGVQLAILLYCGSKMLTLEDTISLLAVFLTRGARLQGVSDHFNKVKGLGTIGGEHCDTLIEGGRGGNTSTQYPISAN